jgi:hypothetical protein
MGAGETLYGPTHTHSGEMGYLRRGNEWLGFTCRDWRNRNMKDQCPSCSDVWHLSRKLQTFEVIHKVDGEGMR